MRIGLINSSTYIEKTYGNTEGYISRMYIDNPKYGTFTYHYTSDNLAKLPVLDEENLYISQNTFFRPIRNKDNLKRLNMLYMDLDCYKIGLSKEKVFYILCDEYIGRKIPRPTYIVDSGRGLYLLWRINEDRNAFPRWKKVQKYLHETLKDLGSDCSVVEDTARVLRVPGSINSKSGTRVEIIREYDYTYTLYEIIKDYIPEQEVTYKKDKPKIKKYGKLIKFTTLNTLYYSRIKDIEKLLLMRDKLNRSSYRENCLFLYRFYCCQYYNDTQKALQMTLDLYRKLSDQSEYTEKDIALRTKSGEKYYLKGNVKFTNKKIIELLGITKEEQDKLTTLISKENAKLRKAERNRKAYKRRLEAQGKNTKGQAKEIRRKQIKELIKENKSVYEICKTLKISKSTYYRELEVIKNEDSLVEVQKNNTNENKQETNNQICEKGNVLNCDSQKFSPCIMRDVVPLLTLWEKCVFLDLILSLLPRGQP